MTLSRCQVFWLAKVLLIFRGQSTTDFWGHRFITLRWMEISYIRDIHTHKHRYVPESL